MRALAIAICLALAAQDADSAARHRFEIARKHHELGRFEDAVSEYLAVYELKPIPDVLFNVAQCYRNLGDEKRAIFFFERYLRETKRPKDRARVQKLIAELELELEEERPIETAVEVEPETPPIEVAPPIDVAAPIEEQRSVIEEWWFWTAIGAVAAAVAGGTAAALVLSRGDPGGTITTIDAR